MKITEIFYKLAATSSGIAAVACLTKGLLLFGLVFVVASASQIYLLYNPQSKV